MRNSSAVLLLGTALFAGAFASTSSAGKLDRAGSTAEQRTAFPDTISMMSPKLAHWAPVVAPVSARTRPSSGAPAITTVSTVTGDGTQNLVLLLKQTTVRPGQTWFEVRLPILPDNSVGWVPRSALGNIYTVTTHLYVDRETQTLVLKRNDVPIFTTRVGVGRTYWPTPTGQYYIRDKLTNFNNPFYGPIAFGTSARSTVLTDWPGGGFVGIHGTNEPGLIPGHISHGCIRLVNAAILRLARLMPVGTPLTVT